MTNGFETSRRCSLDPDQIIEGAVTVLTKMGYALETRDGWHVELKKDGKWSGERTLDFRHSVLIDVVPGEVRFGFTTGWIASHWAESDRKEAEARVDHILAAVTSAGDQLPSGMARCKYCGKVNQADADACSACGAKVFW